MTSTPDLHPAQIPGYACGSVAGPFAHRPKLLEERLFWLGHLMSCIDNTDAEDLLFDTDYDAGADVQSQIFARADWPVFTVPLHTNHRLYVVYRTFEEDPGIDYLLHHPDWDSAETLAIDEGGFPGRDLSWPELVAAADNALPGGTTVDPHARLLLLLPALGDDAIPDDAVDRLTAAVRARTRVTDPRAFATTLLEGQNQWGPAHWTTTQSGVRVNDGKHSFRNPANPFALPPAALARVSAALAP